LEGAVGLSNVLARTAELDAVLQTAAKSDLHVLASGPTPPNASELLASESMADVVSQLRARYDYVLIDAPPTLPVADAASLAVQSDGVIVVVRNGRTRRDELMRTREMMIAVGADVVGVVVNFEREPDRGAYGYAALPLGGAPGAA
jgi:capsular exopolysaccharide synthesis family protein